MYELKKTDAGSAIRLSMEKRPGSGEPNLPETVSLIEKTLRADVVMNREGSEIRIELAGGE